METSTVDKKKIDRINAAMISAGIGSAALAVLIVLTEMSASVKTFLTLNEGVGALSGKTVFSIAIWLLTWAILDKTLPSLKISFEKAYRIMLVLVGLGLLGTFPTFFLAFATH